MNGDVLVVDGGWAMGGGVGEEEEEELKKHLSFCVVGCASVSACRVAMC